MKPKFIVNLASLLVAVFGAVLSIGDKITTIPGLPDQLVNAWPLVFFSATVIHRVGSALVAFGQPKK